MAKLVRRQHVVSKFYLRGFAKDQRIVRRVELPGDNICDQSITDATVVKDIYSITLPDGTVSDAFEGMFADVEGVAAKALTGVVIDKTWPLPSDQREALAAWAALQHLRGQSTRSAITEIQASLLGLLIRTAGKEPLRELISRSEGREIADGELNEEWADLTKPSGPDLVPQTADHLKSLMSLWNPTAASMLARPWSIVHLKRKSLLTGDHPVSMIGGPGHPSSMGLGIMTAGAFLLPLDRHTGLIIGDFGMDGAPDIELPPTTALAKTFIDATVANTRRHLYHHPEDNPLHGIDLPSPRQSEITHTGGDIGGEHGMLDRPISESQRRDARRIREASATNSGPGITFGDIAWPISNRMRRRPPAP
jgi:Protein of unknown function (DUF4238)